MNALLATVLAIGAAVLTRIWRRPALAHGLWLLVLLKLVTPPLFLVPIPTRAHEEVVPAKPVAPPVPSLQENDAAMHASLDSQADAPVQIPEETLLAAESVPPTTAALPTTTRPEPLPVDEALTPVPEAPSAQPFSWKWPLAGLWAAGALGWWSLAAIRIGRLRRVLRLALPATGDISERVAALSRRLGLNYVPTVYLLPAPLPPMLWAVAGAPRILVPRTLWQSLTEDQQDTLLLHELAHLRRGDHWVRRLELLTLGLYWWHPVAWWARHELQEAEEQCCDAWVVQALPAAAEAYAGALLATMAFLSQPRWALPVGASGMGQVLTLKRRMAMILQPTARAVPTRAGFWGVLALGAILLPLVPGWSQSPPRVEEEEQAPPRAVEQPTPALNPPAREPVPAPPRVSRPARIGFEQYEAAQDDVELLQAQVEGKKAEAQEVIAQLRKATTRFQRVSRLQATGAVGAEDIDEAKGDVETLEARLQVKQAGIREAQLRLTQAKRRLARMAEARTAPPADPFVTMTPTTRRTPDPRPTAASAEPRTTTPQPPPTLGSPRLANPTAESPFRPPLVDPVASSRPLFDRTPSAAGDRDRRLEELELKLDRLFREVNALRDEIRPLRRDRAPSTTPSSESRPAPRSEAPAIR
jgi:beta-lactamase regulating signal transducer with metallopeptidase domain